MTDKANPHHLVLGTLKDYLTGQEIPDTLDERYLQKIACYLVERLGFLKSEILSKIPLTVSAGERKATLKIDFIIRCKGKAVIFIKYAPGSLVTRRISTLALSRVAESEQIPYIVVTNGEDAEILDENGDILYEGLKNIPSRNLIIDQFDKFSFKPIGEKMFDQASRIAFACEIDGACPCDSDVCVIEE